MPCGLLDLFLYASVYQLEDTHLRTWSYILLSLPQRFTHSGQLTVLSSQAHQPVTQTGVVYDMKVSTEKSKVLKIVWF